MAEAPDEPDRNYLGRLISWPHASILDVASGQLLLHLATNAAMALPSPDARWLAVAHDDGTLSLIDLEPGWHRLTWDGSGRIAGLTFRPQQDMLSGRNN